MRFSVLCLLMGALLGVGCDGPSFPGSPNGPGDEQPPLPGDGSGPRGCAGQSMGATPATLEGLGSRGPYGFATRDLVFVDNSRPTLPNRSFPGAPQRTLPTRIYYPVCPPDTSASPPSGERIPVAGGGPFPLLAYAHGLTSLGDTARHVTEHLATHGYIIVAPLFPLSVGTAPGGPTFEDTANQPADLAFVMRQVAQLTGANADLGGAVDTRRRALLGFSLGGMTVLIGTYHPVLALDGIQSSVVQAPAITCILGPAFFARPLPTLIISGTADELIPISAPERIFSLAPAPVILVELLGGTHSGFMNREVPFVQNTDTMECQALLDSGATGDQDALHSRFAEELRRGAGPGVLVPGGCTPLCSQRFTQTMGATRQLRLVRAATLAHFEATLRNRWDAMWFLSEQLGEEPDADVFVKK
ncbi:alpha/beta hydrolase family protein [Cystobacter fuscus]|uniref:alpha/beta hydrolase family protein n=1 Tax=Cystobacter fuscus TaxID=43 RepID=UPI0037BF6D81